MNKATVSTGVGLTNDIDKYNAEVEERRQKLYAKLVSDPTCDEALAWLTGVIDGGNSESRVFAAIVKGIVLRLDAQDSYDREQSEHSP